VEVDGKQWNRGKVNEDRNVRRSGEWKRETQTSNESTHWKHPIPTMTAQPDVDEFLIPKNATSRLVEGLLLDIERLQDLSLHASVGIRRIIDGRRPLQWCTVRTNGCCVEWIASMMVLRVGIFKRR